MRTSAIWTCTASALALLVAGQAQASERGSPQDQSAASPEQNAPPSTDTQETASPDEEIVVTGIRNSLERAAEIKQEAVQVVDSIVAQDIGKLPDPTTSAALQRVPGIQVSVNRNNELGDVRVRGLPDVLTTVNGREMFTTTGRRLDLQDIPAEALAGIDVYKSQTPDLIEGGLAGVIDLRLNKPFSFNKPTVVASARANYAVNAEAIDPQFGLLVTDRWDTGIGEIGVLVNGTFSDSRYKRDQTTLFGLRSASANPINQAGILIPNILQTFPEEGSLRRSQFNAAIQWRPTDALEVYVDGLYTRFRDRGARYGANTQAFTQGVRLVDVDISDNCYDARVNANGQNPTVQVDAEGNKRLQDNQTQTLCYLNGATLENPVVNLTTQARNIVQVNKQIGGGVTFDQDGTRINADVSYQTSRNDRTFVVVDIGKRLPSLSFRTDVDNTAQYEIPGNALLTRDDLYIRNSFQQQFGLTQGDLFAAKLDGEREIGGIISKIKVGARFARRAADSYQLNLNTRVPGGNIGTPSEAEAVLVSDTGLPDSFLAIGSPAAGINGGHPFIVPNPEYLLSPAGLDALRTYVGLPTGRPDFQPDRQFNAREKTYAAYGQVEYDIPLGATATLDGVIGGRYVKTDRTIETFEEQVEDGVTTYTPLAAATTDEDFLPTATARLRFDNGIQARLGYTKSIRRPDFGSLNPAITLVQSNNPFVQSGGSAGNPNLRQQKSNSYDATLEYYFDNGYVAVAGYYREITDRVINGAATETYDGIDYSVTRPRNIGAATLKGVEVSGQYFFDFLPGALSGFGLQGAFTLADSEIGGEDPLAGNPLQGVSKYNYTAGLLYDKAGLSGRLVYTYRSRYFDSDETGSISVRPFDPAREEEAYVPPLLAYVRPAGRLDFNIGYDVNEQVRFDIGGVNILRNKTKNYLGQSFQSFENYLDETTYTVGVRVRL